MRSGNLVMTLAAALGLGACAIGGDDGRPDGEPRGPGIGVDSGPAGDDEGVRLDLPAVGSSTGDESGSTGSSSSSGSTGEGSTGGADVDEGSTSGEEMAGSSSTGAASSTGEGSTSGDTSTGSSTGDEPVPEPEPPAPDFCGDGACTGAETEPACWGAGFCPGDCLSQPKCLSDCPCSPGITTFCNLAPGVCSATKPGGYCDPNGDGAYFDGDFTKGNMEHSAKCG